MKKTFLKVLLVALALGSLPAFAGEEKALAAVTSPSGLGELKEANCPSPSDALAKPDTLVETNGAILRPVDTSGVAQ